MRSYRAGSTLEVPAQGSPTICTQGPCITGEFHGNLAENTTPSFLAPLTVFIFLVSNTQEIPPQRSSGLGLGVAGELSVEQGPAGGAPSLHPGSPPRGRPPRLCVSAWRFETRRHAHVLTFAGNPKCVPRVGTEYRGDSLNR